MRMLRWLILGASVLGLLVVAAPFLVPLKQFTPQLSELISMRLGHPVALTDLRLSLWPTPGATVQGARIGKGADIVAEDIRIEPALLSLLGDAPVIKLLRARKVKLNPAALAILQGLSRRGRAARPEASSGLRVERIVLEDVALVDSTLRLRSFDLELRFGPGNSLRQAVFAARDGSFRLAMAPQGADAFALDVQAKNWTLPLKDHRLTFASLAARGVLDGDRVAFSPIAAVLYGGRVGGELTLGWGARSTLTSTAKHAAALADGISLHAPFQIDKGAFGGMDLSKAASLSRNEISSDGETPFEQFSGTLQVRGHLRRVEDFCARSSALVAGGNVQVDARERLSGRLDVSVANTAGLVKVPVRLSGTPTNPVATPSRMMSIGAIIGTLLLPGVGTALGASAASLLEGQAGCS
jgi:hypothetical protein